MYTPVDIPADPVILVVFHKINGEFETHESAKTTCKPAYVERKPITHVQEEFSKEDKTIEKADITFHPRKTMACKFCNKTIVRKNRRRHLKTHNKS